MNIKKLFKLSLIGSLVLAVNQAYAAELPSKVVSSITLNDTPLDKALKLITEGSGISSVKVDADVNWLISTKNLSGNLNEIVDYLVAKSDLTYEYDRNVLHVHKKILKSFEPLEPLPVFDPPVKPAKRVIDPNITKPLEVDPALLSNETLKELKEIQDKKFNQLNEEALPTDNKKETDNKKIEKIKEDKAVSKLPEPVNTTNKKDAKNTKVVDPELSKSTIKTDKERVDLTKSTLTTAPLNDAVNDQTKDVLTKSDEAKPAQGKQEIVDDVLIVDKVEKPSSTIKFGRDKDFNDAEKAKLEESNKLAEIKPVKKLVKLPYPQKETAIVEEVNVKKKPRPSGIIYANKKDEDKSNNKKLPADLNLPINPGLPTMPNAASKLIKSQEPALSIESQEKSLLNLPAGS